MNILPRDAWTPAQVRTVADLILNPATNGGTRSELTPDLIAEHMPDCPAWGVFDGDRAVFTVALNPYSWNPEMTHMRGILHVSGTGELRDAWQVVRGFLESMPGVEVLTFTDRPALARLARRAGLDVVGRDGPYLILARAEV